MKKVKIILIISIIILVLLLLKFVSEIQTEEQQPLSKREQYQTELNQKNKDINKFKD